MYNFSVHSIQEKDRISFSPLEYSKFKYGNSEIARKYAREIGTSLINFDTFNELLKNRRDIFVLSSPYSFIRTASSYIAEHLFYFLSSHFLNSNIQVHYGKINRKVSYIEDYGQMNASERFNLIAKDEFSCDYDLLKDKLIIALDDIRVTGTHERIVENVLTPILNCSDVLYTYFIKIESQCIEPQYENYLNYYYVKSIDQIQAMIKESDFQFNTRVVKYILSQEENSFKEFISYMDLNQIYELYKLSLGNLYYIFHKMQFNIYYLKEIVDHKIENIPQFINRG
jgi:hypothetical protein